MTIEPPDSNSPDKGRSFEDLLKQIQPKLDAIPQEMRIAPLPPSEMVFEEVKSYIVELGLPVGGTTATVITVGGEFVERVKFGVGRAGTLRVCLKGVMTTLPVFAFLYPKTKGLTVYGIFPRDGVHPRKLGQAVYWGMVSDIPPNVAGSAPLTMDEFWKIDAFDKRQLVEKAVLESIKRDLEKERDDEIRRRVSSAEAEVAQLRRKNPGGPQDIEQLRRRSERNAADAVKNHNLAEMWKLTAILFTAVAMLLALVVKHLT
jgi:hypothetical protein